MEAEKGAPLDEVERAILAQRVAVARAWLADFAPERYRVEVRQDGLPDEVAGLDDAQRAYLIALADAAAGERPAAGDAWQDLIFRTAAGAGAALGAGLRRHLPRLPGPPERPARGLAAGEPGAGFVDARLRAAASGRPRRTSLRRGCGAGPA